MTAPRVVLVGVAGSGKTTVGRLLATALDVAGLDADDFHSSANRARMTAGQGLDDDARVDWLAAVHQQVRSLVQQQLGFVLACSALRACYRQQLAADLPPFCWVHLQVDPATLHQRLQRRTDHFFPATLLPSQLATWEALATGLVVDGTDPPTQIVATIRQWLRH